MRNDAYNELLDYCKEKYPNATKGFVIKTILGLRISFRRELKKVLQSQKKSGSSADDVYVPSLWYYELLSSISDCETPRQGKCSLDIVCQVRFISTFYWQKTSYNAIENIAKQCYL